SSPGVLSKFLDGERLPDNVNTTHRLVEALKFAFGRRGDLGDTPSSELEKALQDPHLLEGIAANITEQPVQDVRHYGEHFWSRMDKGTAQLGIMAANGDAVVMATSLNSDFGARVLSKRTGVLFNDVLNDFDLPNVKNQYGLPSSTANQLEPNKRPLSSLAPSLVLRNKKVVVGVSASGGGYIVSSIAQVVMRLLWMRRSVKEAVDWGRVHHQLFPNVLNVEKTVDTRLVLKLGQRGHQVSVLSQWPNDVMILARGRDDRIYVTHDYRRQTNTDLDGE
ncbi:unnamed protein product, partial [Ixodes persulcatus]